MNNPSVLKNLSKIGFIIVAIVYIIALTTGPAQGYELNIYNMLLSNFLDPIFRLDNNVYCNSYIIRILENSRLLEKWIILNYHY